MGILAVLLLLLILILIMIAHAGALIVFLVPKLSLGT